MADELIPNLEENLFNQEKYEINEKTHLIKKLKRITYSLENDRSQSIDEYYENLTFSEETSTKEVRCQMKPGIIQPIFYIISISFTVINLIGIFEIIHIMNCIFTALSNYITIFFQIFKGNENKIDFNSINFYNLFYDKYSNEEINFDLMLFMDFLGGILLNFIGFFCSSLLFMVTNIISILLILNYDFISKREKNLSVIFYQILYLFLCYALLFVGVGSSAMLSLQITKDYYSSIKLNLNEYNKLDYNNQEISINENKDEIKKEENKNNDFGYFIIICITTILGFFGKYFLNSIILEKKFEYDRQFNKDNNNTYNNNESDYESLIIFSYYINDTDNIPQKAYNNNEIYYHDKELFTYNIAIYCLCVIVSILISLIFLIFFKKKKKRKDKKEQDFQIYHICCYTIYKESLIINRTSCCKSILECIVLLCESINNCCNSVLCNIFNKCNKNADCECCCCCCDYNEKDFERNKVSFCYCYQDKRVEKWFNTLLTNEIQKEIILYIIEYYYLQMTTIAFESQYNNNIDEINESIKNYIYYIYFGSFLLFLYASFSSFFFLKKTKKYSNLSGIHGILIFNSIFSLIFSSFYLSGNNINNYISIPILMDRFYLLSFNYFCVSLEELYDKSELLISGSTFISLYLYIGDIIFNIMKEKLEIKILYIFQIIFSSIVCLLLIIVLVQFVIVSLKRGAIINFLLCLFSYCLCFGGIWYLNDEKDCLFCCENCRNCFICYCEDRLCKFYCCCCNSSFECCECCECCNCCEKHKYLE